MTDEAVTEQDDPADVPPRGFVEQVTRGEIATARQQTPLPPPSAASLELPLDKLDPGVFEQLVAELVTRQNNRGAHFYGRSGQKQWGLDIVEQLVNDTRELYQVRRRQQLKPADIRSAVTDYAGDPRTPGDGSVPRRFDPTGFTLVTSATFEHDTGNIDELDALRAEYKGDLQLAVWGAEEVARRLRNEPHIVAAIFGEHWARQWCGVEVNLPAPATPASLGFVESPYEVLGLTTLRTEADSLVGTDPARAAERYRTLADELERGGFPGHAASVALSHAQTLRAAGDRSAAFEALTDITLARLHARSSDSRTRAYEDLKSLAGELGPIEEARAAAIGRIGSWHQTVCDLATVVPAIEALAAAGDRCAPELVCFALEQAVVDGWYDLPVADSVFHTGLVDPTPLVSTLRQVARTLEPADITLRARIRTALADADLLWDASAEQVEAAFQGVVNDANSGRLLRARSLVLSRAAFAFAIRGCHDRAENLWRQAALTASEDGFYGDVRGVLRAAQRLEFDRGEVQFEAADLLRALPNRNRIISGAYDPELSALERAQNNKWRDAYAEARRFLFERRISGHWDDWLNAVRILGDALTRTKRPANAAYLLVSAGISEAAADATRKAGGFVDVRRWLSSPVPRVRAAAARSIRAQVPLIPTVLDTEVQVALAGIGASVWTLPWISPSAGQEAIRALASFGDRLVGEVANHLDDLVGSARTQQTEISDNLARLLTHLYWSVPARRADVAAVLRDMLRLEQGATNLWDLVQAMPPEARGEIVPIVTELADVPDVRALNTLAVWAVPNDRAQYMARLACASLLRNEVGVPREAWEVNTQAEQTVELLKYLAGIDSPVDISIDRLAPAHRFVAGGTLMRVEYGPSAPPPPGHIAADPGADRPDAEAAAPAAPTVEPDPADAEAANVPDDVAHLAAGPVGGLLAAVALHLTAVAEDSTDYGPQRVRATAALVKLIELLDGPTAAEIGQRMFALHLDPNLSDVDQFTASTNDPLSAFQINLGAAHLSPFALMAAAECYRRAHDVGPALLAGGTQVDEAIGAALPLLASEDTELQRVGARVLAALSGCGAPPDLLLGLLAHPNAAVRAIAASEVALPPHLLGMLARDPAPMVRAAAAQRPGNLSAAALEALKQDPHADVRAVLNAALSPDSHKTSASEPAPGARPAG